MASHNPASESRCGECGGTLVSKCQDCGTRHDAPDEMFGEYVERGGSFRLAPIEVHCRYCGWALPAPPTDDPRSWECSDCLGAAHGEPIDLPSVLERAGWERRGGVGVNTTWIEP